MRLQGDGRGLQDDVVERGHDAEGGTPLVAAGGAEGTHLGHVDVDAFGDLRRTGPVGAQPLRGHPADPREGTTSCGGSPEALLCALASSDGAVPASIARLTSSLVTRPPGPVPSSRSASTP